MTNHHENELRSRLSKILNLNNLTRDDVRSILADTSRHLEALDIKSSYPELNFYRDWALHGKLEFKKAKEILEEIDQILANDTGGNPIDKISEALKTKQFRSQLITVFKNANLDTMLFTNKSNWEGFLYQLLSWVETTPIQRQNIKTSVPRVESFKIVVMDNLDDNSKLQVKALCEKLGLNLKSESAIMQIKVCESSSDCVLLELPFMFTERPEAFN